MFFKNLLKTKKFKKTNFLFNAFENFLSEEKTQTNLCYNLFVEDGTLVNGFGFSNLVLPTSDGAELVRTINTGDYAKCDLWHFPCFDKATGVRQDKIFCSTECGNLVYFDIFALAKTAVFLETNYSSLPSAVSYTSGEVDKMLFSGSGKLTSFSVGSFSTTEAVLPQFVDLAWGYGRLFGVVEGKRDEIMFSDNLDPAVWTENENKIVFTDTFGSANKLIVFNDDLYVFRDYGITRISEFGVAKDIELFNLYSSKSKIYGKSVVRCGDKILFLARNGLYSFNGSKVQKILPKLTKYLARFDNKNAVGAFDGQNYLLALRLNFFDDKVVGCEEYEGGFTNNAILVYNIFEGTANLVRGVDVRSLLKVSTGCLDKVFATFYGEHKSKIAVLDLSGCVFDKALLKFWQSKNFDFGAIDKIKNVRQVFVHSNNNCITSLKTDSEAQSFVVVGKKEYQKIRTFTKGKQISVEISATESAKILPPKIVVEEEK